MWKVIGTFGLTFGLAGPVGAECLGSCMDGLIGAFVAMLIYGSLGIAVLVMLIREKWRRGGVKLLIMTVVVAVGVPLVSQTWQGWKLHRMEGREIAEPLPALDGKVLLLVTDSINACHYDPCGLVLADRGEAGAYALPRQALDGVDLGHPVSLADLPLELWQPPVTGTGVARSRPLSAEERKVAAERIDYLIVLAKPWYSEAPEPAEAALSQRPELADMAGSERVNLAFGPVSGGKLDLLGMPLDLLDLWLESEALALVLAPENMQDPGNEIVNRDGLASVLCTEAALSQQWDCSYALD